MTTNKPHKHAEVIKAWADGAVIQYKTSGGRWADVFDNYPLWSATEVYRVKPREPREFFVNTYPGGFDICHLHESREAADALASANRIECIKVREVIE